MQDSKTRETALLINNLAVSYDENIALENVCMRVFDREYLGIIGPNGGGKTTLLRAILGLIPVTSGSIEIYGKQLRDSDKAIGYVPQISTLDKKFPITVKEVILSGMLNSQFRLFHKYSAADKKAAEQALDRVGILDLKDRMISALSGGEFQRMLIARALAVKPKILLLDEPTASVDVTSRDQIYKMLKELNQTMTIIMVTHDMLAVSSHVKSLACLNKRLVYHGEPEINADIVDSLYGCPIELIAHGVPHRVLKSHGEK